MPPPTRNILFAIIKRAVLVLGTIYEHFTQPECAENPLIPLRPLYAVCLVLFLLSLFLFNIFMGQDTVV